MNWFARGRGIRRMGPYASQVEAWAGTRFTVLDGGAALAESFDATTRIGDIAGQLHRAAQAPRRGHRGSKVGGHALTTAEIRAEQSAAWMLGLGEIRDHGHSVKVDAAMEVLLGVMDDDMRSWAVARRASRANIDDGRPINGEEKNEESRLPAVQTGYRPQQPERFRDATQRVKCARIAAVSAGRYGREGASEELAGKDSGGPAISNPAGRDKRLGDEGENSSATSARPSPPPGTTTDPRGGAAEGVPPSGSRPLIAGDRGFQRLRFAAQDSFDELAGFTGGGIARIGANLPERARRELADAAKGLSVACHEPPQGGGGQGGDNLA